MKRLYESTQFDEICKKISSILEKCGVHPYDSECYEEDKARIFKCFDYGSDSLGDVFVVVENKVLYINFKNDDMLIDQAIEVANKQIKVAKNIKKYEKEISRLFVDKPVIDKVNKLKDDDAVYFTVFGTYNGKSFEVQYNTFDREFVFDKFTEKSFDDYELNEIENSCHLYLMNKFREYR